jgi:hypothetical protein
MTKSIAAYLDDSKRMRKAKTVGNLKGRCDLGEADDNKTLLSNFVNLVVNMWI